MFLADNSNLENIDKNILIFAPECERNTSSIDYWILCLNSSDERELLINRGVNHIKDFVKTDHFKFLNFKKTNSDYLNYNNYKKIVKRSYSF